MFGEIVRVDVRSEEGGAIVVSGTNSTVILGPYDLGDRASKTFVLYNQHASLTLSGALIQVNPDRQGSESMDFLGSQPGSAIVGPNPALWLDVHTATVAPNTTATRNFFNIGPGVVRGVIIEGYHRWWRIVGTNDGTAPITVSGWVYAGSL